MNKSDLTVGDIALTPSNAVTFISGGIEVLSCSDKGFWVRGKKVKIDDNEARIVYNSFKEWLTWQHISRG
jgi:hypothetical protein